MTMRIGEYLRSRNVDADTVAARLAEHGVVGAGKNDGRPITADAIVKRAKNGDVVPKSWYTALGLDPPVMGKPGRPRKNAAAGDRDHDGDEPSSGRRETPPQRPDEAAIAILDSAGARKRISGAYKFAGAALAAGSGSQGVAHVWGDQSDRIADLWLEAAQDNPWAARFVNVMQAGGPMGDLAAGHLYLVGATLYVLGAGIPGGDAIFAKYSRYRPPVRPGPGQAAAANGAAGDQTPTADAGAEPAAAGAVADG